MKTVTAVVDLEVNLFCPVVILLTVDVVTLRPAPTHVLSSCCVDTPVRSPVVLSVQLNAKSRFL